MRKRNLFILVFILTAVSCSSINKGNFVQNRNISSLKYGIKRTCPSTGVRILSEEYPEKAYVISIKDNTDFLLKRKISLAIDFISYVLMNSGNPNLKILIPASFTNYNKIYSSLKHEYFDGQKNSQSKLSNLV